MMIFRAVGGLGNQLFIVAAAMAASNHWGDNFQIDMRGAAKGIERGGPHLVASDLQSLVINGRQFRNSGSQKLAYGFLEFTASIESRIQRHLREQAQLGISFTSGTTGYNQTVYSQKKLYTRGYFQSYRYLQYLRDNSIGFNLQLAKPSPQFMELTKQFNVENSTVVHLRRGDYLKHADSFGILASSYYQKSLDKLKSLGKLNPVLVFSDDEARVSQMIRDGLWAEYKAQLVPTSGLDPAEVLMMMSKSCSFVIANSSFSWWAAALNEKSHVIHPSTWFKSEPSPYELFFPNWIAQESAWQ